MGVVVKSDLRDWLRSMNEGRTQHGRERVGELGEVVVKARESERRQARETRHG
jgi:hypothetical protein